MEFWITVIGLMRRKAVIIPALLIAVAMGATAYLITPTSWVSSTTMVLTTTQYGGTESRDPTKPTDLTNPMLNFNDSLTTTSAILIEAMNTTTVDEKLGATGATQLIIDDGRTNPDLLGLNGPFVYIVGRSTSPEAARRVVLQAQIVAREKLRVWQVALNAPEKTYVTLAEVVPPSAPQPVHGRAVKYGILGFLFGFVVSMATAYFWHKRQVRRRARLATQASEGPTAPAESPAVRDLPPLPRAHSRADGDRSDGDEQEDAAHEPAAVNGVVKPAAESSDLNGVGSPAVEPSDVNGVGSPAVEPSDVNGVATPAVEPVHLNGATAPDLAPPGSRRRRSALLHVPVKRQARSRTP